MATINETQRLKLKEKYRDEIIYVYSPELFKDFGDGFTPLDNSFLSAISPQGFFMQRYAAEYNNSILQPIPYIVLIHHDTKQLFLTRRIGGEERLLNKYAFIGGHVNPIDSKSNDVIINAAFRELDEEVLYQPASDLKFIGLLKDENSATSEHIGFIFIQEIFDAAVKESDRLEGIWLTLHDAVENIHLFESWGQFLINMLREKERTH